MNQISTQLPKRWTYPQNEYNENSVHIKQALDHQYGGNNNDLMWILKQQQPKEDVPAVCFIFRNEYLTFGTFPFSYSTISK